MPAQTYALLLNNVVTALHTAASGNIANDVPGPAAAAYVPVPAGATVSVGMLATNVNDVWSFATAPTVALSQAQQAAVLLAGGLAITSTSAPALNGTYPCDAATIANIDSIQLGIASGDGLPKGASTVPWFDVTHTPHAFTAGQFSAFAVAARDFVAACDLFGAGLAGATAPTAAATIA